MKKLILFLTLTSSSCFGIEPNLEKASREFFKATILIGSATLIDVFLIKPGITTVRDGKLAVVATVIGALGLWKAYKAIDHFGDYKKE